MSTIVYTNEWGMEIDESSGDSWNKVYRDGKGNLQRIESYEKSALQHATIFVITIEEAYDLLMQGINAPSIEFCMFTAAKGEYRQYERFYLSPEGIASGFRIYVYGEGIFPVYDKANPVSADLHDQTWKYIYLPEVKVDYEFMYHTDGSFKSLTVYDPLHLMGTEDHLIYPEEVGKDKNVFGFDWKGMEYFRHALPILPQEDISSGFLPHQFRLK